MGGKDGSRERREGGWEERMEVGRGERDRGREIQGDLDKRDE